MTQFKNLEIDVSVCDMGKFRMSSTVGSARVFFLFSSTENFGSLNTMIIETESHGKNKL